MPLVMRIEGLATGQATPFDGQFLAEYDPGKNGQSPDGMPMLAHVVTTPDPGRAIRFPSMVEYHECWTRVDPRQPVRADGQPNRPLTAFSVSTETVT